MTIINVSLKENPYKIHVGAGILKNFGRQIKSLNIGSDAIVISHPKIVRLHGKALISGLKAQGISVKVLTVPEGEASKSAARVFELIEQIARYDILKKVFIIAFGGGVIGDLAGYVAASYKRGIPYVQIPTTFLAQIDSAIGGKVGIDLPQGKNLVGAFHQPKAVLSDVNVLKTLPTRQLKNGMAEAIKYGIIADKNFFSYLEKYYPKVLAADTKTLAAVVYHCSRIKRNVVVSDEKETEGLRTILNFGHTVGHAIEAGAKYNFYQHGEAIGLGMRVATEMSAQLKLVSGAEAERINRLITAVGLPKQIQKVSLAKILGHMRHDKKFTQKKMRFVLVKQIGKVIVREGISLGVVKSAIQKWFGASAAKPPFK